MKPAPFCSGDEKQATFHYHQVWIHNKRKPAPARMNNALFIQETKKFMQTLAKFYLPGPDGYGCVPVTTYSSSCPKEQFMLYVILCYINNYILYCTANNALKQQIEENRAGHT